MGYSFRRYFVARDDLIYRMATAAFDRMLREPARFRMPDLAGQRVRSAEIVVELVGGDGPFGLVADVHEVAMPTSSRRTRGSSHKAARGRPRSRWRGPSTMPRLAIESACD